MEFMLPSCRGFGGDLAIFWRVGQRRRRLRTPIAGKRQAFIYLRLVGKKTIGSIDFLGGR
jgi:hypothetical protein